MRFRGGWVRVAIFGAKASARQTLQGPPTGRGGCRTRARANTARGWSANRLEGIHIDRASKISLRQIDEKHCFCERVIRGIARLLGSAIPTFGHMQQRSFDGLKKCTFGACEQSLWSVQGARTTVRPRKQTSTVDAYDLARQGGAGGSLHNRIQAHRFCPVSMSAEPLVLLLHDGARVTTQRRARTCPRQRRARLQHVLRCIADRQAICWPCGGSCLGLRADWGRAP